ncbi:MAG: proprotein convertase P-domain-containing protein [Phycisphaerales bacterium]|nr:proprotein convertase P-domain-containing protein [Phycisphaerales bacterium]
MTPIECHRRGGMYRGDQSVCGPQPCLRDDRGACCLPIGGCEIRNEFSCAEIGGEYLGDGELCHAEQVWEAQPSLVIPVAPRESAYSVVEDIIYIDESLPVEVEDVSLQIEHEYQSDVRVELVRNGDYRDLLNRPGTGDTAAYPGVYYEDNFGNPNTGDWMRITRAARAAYRIHTAEAPRNNVTGRWQPVETQQSRNGADAQGEWRLRVYNYSTEHAGRLVAWRLHLTRSDSPNCPYESMTAVAGP